MSTHTLIPNPDPDLRILLHRNTEHPAAYVTVETADTDAIGGHQWRLRDDGRTEKIAKAAALAMIADCKPASVTSETPTALGTFEFDGLRYRCSVTRGPSGAIMLTTEVEDVDQAGDPRWNVHQTDLLTGPDGAPLIGPVDADYLTWCLYPSA